MHAKSLTLTNHGLALRVLPPLLQCAPEIKGKMFYQNLVLILQSLKFRSYRDSYYKWFETRLNLLVNSDKRYCSIKEGFTKVMGNIFYHSTCSFLMVI